MMPKKNYNDEREASLIALPANKIYLYLLLLGLSAAFISLSLSYIYTRNQNGAGGVYLPPIFIINSFILLLSSWFISRANKCYSADDTLGYQKALYGTLATTILFMVAQFLAWTLAFEQLLGDNIGNGKQYLYALSGLHFAHIVGGIPFLIMFIYTVHKRMQEPVSVLIYFSDPDKRLKLELLTTYWHFLDGLWLFLVALFLGNMFIG
jgi:cytochrome c oxidase subunit III